MIHTYYHLIEYKCTLYDLEYVHYRNAVIKHCLIAVELKNQMKKLLRLDFFIFLSARKEERKPRQVNFFDFSNKKMLTITIKTISVQNQTRGKYKG